MVNINKFNKWNLSHAIHLIQLVILYKAEVILALRRSILRKKNNNSIITNANELICCAAFGEPNRNRHPTIGGRIIIVEYAMVIG